MNLTRAALSVAVTTVAVFYGVAVGVAQQSEEPEVLTIAPGSEIRLPAPWQVSGARDANAQELVLMAAGAVDTAERGSEETVEYPVARILITSEARTSHADALRRLEAIAASRNDPAKFFEIGGWPAVEVQFSERLPRRGARGEEGFEGGAEDLPVQRTLTAVAHDDNVVMFDASILPEAPSNTMERAHEIARGVEFGSRGTPSEVEETLAKMRAADRERPRVLTFAPNSETRFTGPWQLAATKYTNAQELVVMRAAVVADERGVDQTADYPAARMLITTEERDSQAEALQRLEAIAASRDEPARFIEVGGWPAVEVEFSEPLPRRGARGEEGYELAAPTVMVRRKLTAIAQEGKVVIFDTSALPDAPPEAMELEKEVTRNVQFASRSTPAELEKALDTMRVTDEERRSRSRQLPDPTPEPEPSGESAPSTTTVGAPVQVQAGVGELEVATSADANTIVIASNSRLSFSTNRGGSFAAGTTGVFGLNDPSLARSASGNFYLDVIATAAGTAAHLNVTGCTNAVSRSTNNGASFTLQGYSGVCPSTGGGVCFPDQEHIAGDASNAAAGGDQLYAVWRNFTPAGPVPNCNSIGSGFVTPSITCSQNNGVTWTARAAIPGAGDFPRVAVGRDGAVYVVTLSGNALLLNRFSSCASGLTAAAGFPVTVATLSGGVACPVPGLDRCNDGNNLSSPIVAPDPVDANHLFVTFAESDGSGGERIVAVESTNRGASFPTRRTASGGGSARRFMPWSCTTRGSAWVGWYDRGAATGANNDLTDYHLASTSGTHWNLTNNPDPQCASGWPCAPRSSNDSETCSAQPQQAGRCRNAAGGGSGALCDFSAGGCPAGETCRTGGGCPKYGDYNGIACAGPYVVAAWASATAPAGLPAAAGIRVYSSTLLADPAGQVHYWPMSNGQRTGGINIHTPVGADWGLEGVGDVTGDGTADIVWQHRNGQVHYWPMSNGQRTGGFDIHTPVGVQWNLRGVGDVNGDGTADIIWQHRNGQVHYWPMSNGQRTGGFDIHTPVGVQWNLRAVNDVNGDGTADIIWQHRNGQVHYWPMSNGQRTGGLDIHTPVGVQWNLKAAGDVNGDGTADMIWQYRSGDSTADIVWQHDSGQVHYWPIDDGKRTGGLDIHTPVGNQWKLRGVGDVNGDRTADIVWQHDNGQVHYWPMDNGQRTGGLDIHTPVGSSWNLRGVGDVNGDGTADIVWQHDNGQVHYWPMDDGRRTGGLDIHTPVGSSWNLRGVGDVNGDGTADIVWQHVNGQVHYWPMDDGRRIGGLDIHTPVGSSWSLRGVGDMNGDGTADIVWQHDSGQVHYWPMDEGRRTWGNHIHTPVGSAWKLRGVGDIR